LRYRQNTFPEQIWVRPGELYIISKKIFIGESFISIKTLLKLVLDDKLRYINLSFLIICNKISRSASFRALLSKKNISLDPFFCLGILFSGFFSLYFNYPVEMGIKR